MLKKILEFFDSGRTHGNVGRAFYSPHFKRHIVVTAFKSDDNWKFRFLEEKFGHEGKAQSLLSYFENKGLERTDLASDEYR